MSTESTDGGPLAVVSVAICEFGCHPSGPGQLSMTVAIQELSRHGEAAHGPKLLAGPRYFSDTTIIHKCLAEAGDCHAGEIEVHRAAVGSGVVNVLDRPKPITGTIGETKHNLSLR